MKIAVCGKGGSGKSALVTLLATAMRDKGLKPLVVDCDESNSGLYLMLGLAQPPTPIMELLGGKKGIKERLKPKYSPGESAETNVLAREKVLLGDIPSPYVARKDGLRLVSTGKIVQALEGCACPIGVLGREFLKKLELAADEVVIVDMEAGVEHFGRGLETSVDTVLVAVEPSMESITLAERIKHLADGVGIKKLWAVLNKVNSDSIAEKLSAELHNRGVPVIGTIPYDPEVFEACLEGRPLGRGKARQAVDSIVDFLLRQEKP